MRTPSLPRRLLNENVVLLLVAMLVLMPLLGPFSHSPSGRALRNGLFEGTGVLLLVATIGPCTVRQTSTSSENATGPTGTPCASARYLMVSVRHEAGFPTPSWKYSMLVVLAFATSRKMAPNPRTPAGVVVTQDPREAERAARQYQACEPENRLVARELERRWEEALKRQRQLDADHERFERAAPAALSETASSSIRALADIKGHTIGEPGPFGATYVGLLALLHYAHLTTSDVHLQSIGFTQVTALLAHRVDAVVGYSNNEPLQLQKQGLAVRTFDVSDYQPLVSNGLITTENTLHGQPQMVKAFVQATLKGVREVIANPAEAIQISKSYIPGMNVATETAVLQATIPIWQGSGKVQPGYNDSATWQAMAQFLLAEKIIPSTQDVAQAYTNTSLA